MRRLAVILVTLLVAAGLAAPVLAADPALDHSGRVLLSFNGDVTLPEGEQADVVLVTDGIATIRGEVNTVLAFNGTAILEGATVESVVVTGGTVAIDATSTVIGDVRTFDSTTAIDPAAQIGGSVKGLDVELLGIGMVLGPALLLLWIGFAIATLVAALLLAALGARQVRAAEAIIRTEPIAAFAVGLATAILAPIAAIVIMITIIGLPTGLGALFVVLPLLAFVGYLVAAIWIGEAIVGRTRQAGTPAQRPYLAAVVGVVVMLVLGIVPFVPALISLFGFGAVIILGWRVLRGTPTSSPTVVATPQPMAG